MKKHLPSFQVLMSRSPVGEDAIFIDGAGRSIQIVPALCGQENNGGLERGRKGPGSHWPWQLRLGERCRQGLTI